MNTLVIMAERRVIPLSEFHDLLKAQKVKQIHLAFRCVICGTIQSAADLIRAGAGRTFDDVEKYLGFSCIGRWTKAGPHHPTEPPGRGCDWTLGGLLHLHTLEVQTEDGKTHMRFEPVTPEEAQEHAKKNADMENYA